MSLAERFLLALSRDPEAREYADGQPAWSVEHALERIVRAVPSALRLIPGADVLDVGCGSGHQVVAFALAGARHVTGLDTNPRAVEAAGRLAEQWRVSDRVEITSGLDPEARFDLVVSQDSMEHFTAPERMMAQVAHAVRPTGRVVIIFGPPWFAPYGAHMMFFTRVPWVHLLFSERAVMRARARYRTDGATRYEDVEGGLGRLSIARFERLVARSGLVVERCRYRCVRGLNVPQRVPVLRELLINYVECVLRPPTAPL